MTRGAFRIPFVAALMCVAVMSAVRCDNGIPLVSDILGAEKRDTLQPGVQRPVFPPALKAAETVTDAAEFLPSGALYYIEIRNGGSFDNALANTPLLRLSEEKAVAVFLKENGFTLDALYDDLPEEFGSEGIRALGDLGRTIMTQFTKTAGAVTFASYPAAPGNGSSPVGLFLADIGRDRKAAFDQLQQMVGEMVERKHVLAWQESDHAEDYIDIVRAEMDARGRKERYFGVIRNFVFLTDSRDLADRLLAYLNRRAKAERVLADDVEFRTMNERVAPTSHIRGFVSPGAFDSAMMPDAVTSATLQGTTVYYDLEATAAGMLEHLTFPALEGRDVTRRVQELFATAEEVDSSRLRTPHFFPYQPDLVLVVRLRPAKLQELFAGPSSLLPSGFLSTGVPDTLRQVFAREDSLLDGEFGFALLRNPAAVSPDWFFAMTIRNSPEVEKILAGTDAPAKTVSGVPIYSESSRLGTAPAMAVFNVLTFRNLPQPLLEMGSSGTLMESMIEQTIGGKANLALNRDFIKQVDRLKGRSAAVLYLNLPKIVADEYGSLPMIARAMFPRMATLRSRPPLETVQSHVSGLAATLSFTDTSDSVLTVFSPVGVLPSMAVASTFVAPHAIRQQEAEALTQGRILMGRLNVELQLYATQRGHYPASLEELEGTLDEARRNALLTDPGAVRRVGAEDARRGSYAYVSGLRTNDAPDSVLLYSARPWYYQYAEGEDAAYGPCRLVLTLDGEIKAVEEQRFRRELLPAIRKRSE